MIWRRILRAARWLNPWVSSPSDAWREISIFHTPEQAQLSDETVFRKGYFFFFPVVFLGAAFFGVAFLGGDFFVAVFLADFFGAAFFGEDLKIWSQPWVNFSEEPVWTV